MRPATPQSFGEFLATIGSVLETALTEATLTSPPIRPCDVAVAIAFDQDILRRITEDGSKPHLERYREFRRGLPMVAGEQMIPPVILSLLHQCHERFANTPVVDSREFIKWACANNPDVRDKLLQGFDLMFSPGEYMQKHRPRLATLLDLLDRMVEVDEPGVTAALAAFGAPIETLRNSLIGMVLSSPK